MASSEAPSAAAMRAPFAERLPAILRGVTAALAALIATAAPAQEALSPEETPALSARGADSCLGCHAGGPEFPVLAIFETRHALGADPASPFAQLQCESCHGPGAEHTRRVLRGQPQASIRNFGAGSEVPIAEQNDVCLGCHETGAGSQWHGSDHELAELGCASCHTIHAARDPVTVREQQPAICFDCHQRQRTESFMASSHPLRYGQMSCTDCHSPHGGTAAAALTRFTINDSCYGCHAEKRGPFLWEHAPVTENCALCHEPHGSVHPALLTRRPPLLCQQCHAQAGHPSLAGTPGGIPPRGASPLLLAGSCLNCHTQVHGSNHPSGAGLGR